MALLESDTRTIAAFREFVEDALAADERYGPVSRADAPDGSILISQFHAGTGCWFELIIHPPIREYEVAFFTADSAVLEVVDQMAADAGTGIEGLLQAGFSEVGVSTIAAVVRRNNVQGGVRYGTPVLLEELADLDQDGVRDTAVSLMEAFLLTFGPAVGVEDSFEEYDDGDEE